MAAPTAPLCNYESNLKQAQERVSSLITMTENLNGWVPLVGSTIPPSMKIYERRDATNSLITVRGEIEGIKAPAYDVTKWINSLESLPVLDKMAQAANAKMIEEFNDRDCVMYCPYNVPWPLDTRDFLWFQHWASLPSGEEAIYGFSVTRADVPEKKGHVRGMIYDSGYAIRPTSPNTCRISYIVCIDPMGWVPSWANTKTAEQAYCLDFVKQHFDKNPITVSSKPAAPAPAPVEAPAEVVATPSAESAPTESDDAVDPLSGATLP